MNKNTELKVWHISFRQNGRELTDTKFCSRNYVTAAAWARREAKELGTCDKIVMENNDSFKLYVIEL